jgi:phosphate uptake regulator
MEIHFDEELRLLKQKLLGMADTAQEMITLAVTALKQRDDHGSSGAGCP